MDYEIIEEDLANLKRLQSENEKLKKQLSNSAPTPDVAPEAAQEIPAVEEMVEVPAVETEEAAAPPEVEAAAEVAAVEESAPPEPPAEVSSDLGENREEKEKSSEELLSEFEKMLG